VGRALPEWGAASPLARGVSCLYEEHIYFEIIIDTRYIFIFW
jgi:hypothetical protein